MPLISVYLEAEVLRLACYRESSSSDRAAVKYCLKRGGRRMHIISYHDVPFILSY